MSQKTILLVGPGTIGLPTALALCKIRKHNPSLKLGPILVHKRSAKSTDIPRLLALHRAGAEFVTELESRADFCELGFESHMGLKAALEVADVVIDCTGNAKQMWETTYRDHQQPKYIAQGGDHGFGTVYVRDISEQTINTAPQFTQVMSCNTHALSHLNYALRPNQSHFTCLRRASDMGADSMASGLQTKAGSIETYGSHHARDVDAVLKGIGVTTKPTSVASTTPQQHMHMVEFKLQFATSVDMKWIKQTLRLSRLAVTEHRDSGALFEAGQTLGFRGRHLVPGIVSLSSLHFLGDNMLAGGVFVPQQGNVIPSNLSMALFCITNNWQWTQHCVDRFVSDYRTV